jgi:hypothetical protein
MYNLFKKRIDSLFQEKLIDEEAIRKINSQINRQVKDKPTRDILLEYIVSSQNGHELTFNDGCENEVRSDGAIIKKSKKKRESKKTIELFDKNYDQSKVKVSIRNEYVGYSISLLSEELKWPTSIIKRYLKSIYKIDFEDDYRLKKSKIKSLSELIFARVNALRRIDFQNQEKPTFKKFKGRNSSPPGVYGEIQIHGPGKFISIKSK